MMNQTFTKNIKIAKPDNHARELTREFTIPLELRNRQPKLTERERDILKLLTNGYDNREIAEILKVSRRTIEAHRARIMLKLNIHELAGLVKYAIKAGISSLDRHRAD